MVAPQRLHRTRRPSLPVSFTPAKLAILAEEIYEETAHDVLVSLLSYWVCKDEENYEEAKLHIRELALDQGYQTSRITNQSLRQLLDETIEMRPSPPPYVTQNDGLDMLRLHSSSTMTSSQQNMPSVNSPVRSDSGPTSPWSTSSTFRDSPPNTPDRPAPLAIRSRDSKTGATPTPKSAVLRSVSNPIRVARPLRQPLRSASAAPVGILQAETSLDSLSLEEDLSSDWSTVSSGDEDANEDLRRPLAGGESHNRSHSPFHVGENVFPFGESEETLASNQDQDADGTSICDSEIHTAVPWPLRRDSKPNSATSSRFVSPHQNTSLPRQRAHIRSNTEELWNVLGSFEEATPLPRRHHGRTNTALLDNLYASFVEDGSLLSEQYPRSPSRHFPPVTNSPSDPFLGSPPRNLQLRAAAGVLRSANGLRPNRTSNNATDTDQSLLLRRASISTRDVSTGDTSPAIKRYASTSAFTQYTDVAFSTPTRLRRRPVSPLQGDSRSQMDRSHALRQLEGSLSAPSFHDQPNEVSIPPSPARVGKLRDLSHRIGTTVIKRTVSRITSRINLRGDGDRYRSSIETASTSSPRQSSLTPLHESPTYKSPTRFPFKDATPRKWTPSPRRFRKSQSEALQTARKSINLFNFNILIVKTRARGALLRCLNDDVNPSPVEADWLDAHEQLLQMIYGKKGVLVTDPEKDFVESVAREMASGTPIEDCESWKLMEEILGELEWVQEREEYSTASGGL